MPDRPYVLLSVAASVDGYTDDNTDERLLLSNDETSTGSTRYVPVSMQSSSAPTRSAGTIPGFWSAQTIAASNVWMRV